MGGKAPTEGEYRDLWLGVLEGIPRREDLDRGIIRAYLDDKSALHAGIASLLAKVPQADVEVYPVTVDYSKTIEEMVAAGNYGYANPDITTEHFPPKGSGIVEVQIHLKHFNRVMSSDAVLKGLDKMGLRPATPMEILAFGAKYPDIQRQFPIVEMGQNWQSPFGPRVLDLVSDDRERDLHLAWLGLGWFASWRFAAVRK